MAVTIILAGLNHQTTPLALRERLYLREDQLQPALCLLKEAGLSEVAILSTCNRLEIYAVAENPETVMGVIRLFLAGRAGVDEAVLREYLYHRQGSEAAQHLMRVAAGLESLVLGESEILGQVADALRYAQYNQTIGALLSRLFSDALHTGKRVRSETAISQRTLSVSHAAVLLAKRQLPDITRACALVVGAGQMAVLAAQALRSNGVSAVQIINRTDQRAQVLAARLGVQVAVWASLPKMLAEADVVITATSALQPVLNIDMVNAAGKQSTRPLVLVDIGMPRNVDARIRGLPGVLLYDLDDLEAVVAEHAHLRRAEVTQVEAIIAHELERFQSWLNSRSATSTIGELRQRAELVMHGELEQALRRLPELNDHQREVVTLMAHRIVNKLLHAPTTALKERASQGEHHAYLHAVRQLFALEGEDDRRPVEEHRE